MTLARLSRGSTLILGRPVPNPVVALAGAVLVVSVLGALAPGLRDQGLLVPALVWEGEIWRLVTWVFIEVDPLSMVFAILMLGMFGSDLCRQWGPARFVSSVLTLAVVPALVTCLLARLLAARLMVVPYYQVWPVVEGLIIAWALLYPSRRILLFFFLPMEGRTLVWVTVGGTAFFAIFYGWERFVPHFAAEALALVAFDRLAFLRRLWIRARLAAYERDLRRRAGSLHVVPRKDDDDRPRWLH